MLNSRIEKSRAGFGVDVDDLTDDSDTEEDDDDGNSDLDQINDSQSDTTNDGLSNSNINHNDIQEKLAMAGPTGVAAAAAIASTRKRKRPHSFETNPSVRKRQQTRLIRKLRACIDEYTMRVGQQAVVLITMPGKSHNNFKVFGAQPLENVIRACKHDIMAELEHSLLEQAPQQLKEDGTRHELPPLVIDGIPTPVEKMTQAQLRAFIPLMLKYSTGRGKPGWGKDSTRPPWWPETLPWANVRSDAREESEKQRISWTTTLRQIVINCYKFHGRDDLLPTFRENEEATKEQELSGRKIITSRPGNGNATYRLVSQKDGGSSFEDQANIYSSQAYGANFVHTVNNADGTMSIIQVDPANAQLFTLPDGTQVRAVRLQTIDSDAICVQSIGDLPGQAIDIPTSGMAVGEASIGVDGQIIVTGDDGTQSAYPMSNLVSIPASMYQQFTQGNQQLSIITTDGTELTAVDPETQQSTSQKNIQNESNQDDTSAQRNQADVQMHEESEHDGKRSTRTDNDTTKSDAGNDQGKKSSNSKAKNDQKS